jgi:hypothetical protein
MAAARSDAVTGFNTFLDLSRRIEDGFNYKGLTWAVDVAAQPDGVLDAPGRSPRASDLHAKVEPRPVVASRTSHLP